LIQSNAQHLVEFLNKRSSITKSPQNIKPLAKTGTQCTMVGLCTSLGVMRITPHCQLLQCNVVDLVQVGHPAPCAWHNLPPGVLLMLSSGWLRSETTLKDLQGLVCLSTKCLPSFQSHPLGFPALSPGRIFLLIS
jgi:hypothetical protein